MAGEVARPPGELWQAAGARKCWALRPVRGRVAPSRLPNCRKGLRYLLFANPYRSGPVPASARQTTGLACWARRAVHGPWRLPASWRGPWAAHGP